MAGGELAGWWLAMCAAVAAGFRFAGWAGGPFGVTGLALLGGAAIGFGVALARGFGARRVIRAAAAGFSGTGGSGGPGIGRQGLRSVVAPVSRVPRGVTVDAGIPYGPHPRHLLDRIGPAPDGVARPALVHVHGGGWWRGRRHTQARPMIHGLAASGWQVFTPSYRLSPEVAVPGHLVDIKRAIAWIRDNAEAVGVDPSFVAVAGGSTGGNLAALVALTMGDTDLQPGFEGADTTVQACVPLYGVHDLLDEAGHPLWPYLESQVVQVSPATDPEAWRRSSPIRLARPKRPPFLIVHGAGDTLVGADLSRRLAAALRTAGGPPVAHLEVPWANHGFDYFAGPRGAAMAAAISGYLHRLRSEQRQAMEEAG